MFLEASMGGWQLRARAGQPRQRTSSPTTSSPVACHYGLAECWEFLRRSLDSSSGRSPEGAEEPQLLPMLAFLWSFGGSMGIGLLWQLSAATCRETRQRCCQCLWQRWGRRQPALLLPLAVRRRTSARSREDILLKMMPLSWRCWGCPREPSSGSRGQLEAEPLCLPPRQPPLVAADLVPLLEGTSVPSLIPTNWWW